jgi:hypothetical protein
VIAALSTGEEGEIKRTKQREKRPRQNDVEAEFTEQKLVLFTNPAF